VSSDSAKKHGIIPQCLGWEEAFRRRIPTVLHHRKQKSRHGGTPTGIRPSRLTLQQTPRQNRVVFRLVIRQESIIWHENEIATVFDRKPIHWLQSIPERIQQGIPQRTKGRGAFVKGLTVLISANGPGPQGQSRPPAW
jgi:hypothetical protein